MASEDAAASGEVDTGRRYKQWEILFQALADAQESGRSTIHCLDINNVMGMIEGYVQLSSLVNTSIDKDYNIYYFFEVYQLKYWFILTLFLSSFNLVGASA